MKSEWKIWIHKCGGQQMREGGMVFVMWVNVSNVSVCISDSLVCWDDFLQSQLKYQWHHIKLTSSYAIKKE